MTYTEDQMTEWFPRNTKPTKQGLYLIMIEGMELLAYFDTKRKLWLSAHIREGEANRWVFVFQNQKWRGLKEQPR